MRYAFALLVLSLTAAMLPVRAEVVEATPTGFQIKNTYSLAATPGRVYAALGRIGRWWNPEHTWSGKAENLSLQLKAGGCFCELLPESGGSVQHMTVLFAQPKKILRLGGALGPLQSGAVAGTLTFEILGQDDGTVLSMSYIVSGNFPGGLNAIAPVVDQVLGEQMDRFKLYVEAYRPKPPAAPAPPAETKPAP